MPRGGKRHGAGRKPKPGLKVRVPASLKREAEKQRVLPPHLVAQIEAEGPLPLSVMLDNMRHYHQVAKDAEAALESMAAEQLDELGSTAEAQFRAMLAKVKQAAGLRMFAQTCAKECAPYLHAPAKAADKPQTGDTITEEDRIAAIVRAEAEDAGKVVTLHPRQPE